MKVWIYFLNKYKYINTNLTDPKLFNDSLYVYKYIMKQYISKFTFASFPCAKQPESGELRVHPAVSEVWLGHSSHSYQTEYCQHGARPNGKTKTDSRWISDPTICFPLTEQLKLRETPVGNIFRLLNTKKNLELHLWINVIKMNVGHFKNAVHILLGVHQIICQKPLIFNLNSICASFI